MDGYDAAIQTAIDNWDPSAGNYECDSTFVDADGDGYGACIDEDDTDPRVWTRHCEGDPTCSELDEEICDGVDNDGDGTVDDGFTACDLDRKRPMPSVNLQGGRAFGSEPRGRCAHRPAGRCEHPGALRAADPLPHLQLEEGDGRCCCRHGLGALLRRLPRPDAGRR